ncbi:unnamed protein product [Effrenium voratum]|nr:unnamed protein product [Effrenium voratum]
MCCDYRIITWEGSMGLNEVALGIPVPRMWCGHLARQQEADMLLSASMPGSTDLRQLGLVDEIVEKPGDLMPSALTQLKKWLKFPSQARHGAGPTREMAWEVGRGVAPPMV